MAITSTKASSEHYLDITGMEGHREKRPWLEKIQISQDSLLKVCPTREVIVYGWSETRYKQILMAFNHLCFWGNGELAGRITKVWGCDAGYKPDIDDPHRETMDLCLDYTCNGTEHETARRCREGLRNAVLVNYQREKRGAEPITVLFCQEDELGSTPYTTEELSTGTRISYQELRTIWELCNDPDLPEKFREVARRTFHFVKLEQVQGLGQDLHCRVLEIENPMRNNPALDDAMRERQSKKYEAWKARKSSPYQQETERLFWKTQTIDIVNRIDAETSKASEKTEIEPKKGWTCWDYISCIIFPILLIRLCSGTWFTPESHSS